MGPWFNPELGQAIGSMIAAQDAMLLGRVTYEMFAAHWPQQTGEHGRHDEQHRQVRRLRHPGVRGLAELDPDPGGQRAAEIAELKQQPGKNIGMTGSAALVSWLLREGLLDELRLLVFPVVVGSGKRLFGTPGDKLPLKLTDSATFGTGVVQPQLRQRMTTRELPSGRGSRPGARPDGASDGTMPEAAISDNLANTGLPGRRSYADLRKRSPDTPRNSPGHRHRKIARQLKRSAPPSQTLTRQLKRSVSAHRALPIRTHGAPPQERQIARAVTRARALLAASSARSHPTCRHHSDTADVTHMSST